MCRKKTTLEMQKFKRDNRLMKFSRSSAIKFGIMAVSALFTSMTVYSAHAVTYIDWKITDPGADLLSLTAPGQLGNLTRGTMKFTLVPHLSSRWDLPSSHNSVTGQVECDTSLDPQPYNGPASGGIAFTIDGAPDNWAFNTSSGSAAEINWIYSIDVNGNPSPSTPMTLAKWISINGVPAQVAGIPEVGYSFAYAQSASITFSTRGWQGGTYDIHAYSSDGCLGNYSSNTISFTLPPIPTPQIQCSLPINGTATNSISGSCTSSLNLNNVPLAVSANTGQGWNVILNGVANGLKFPIPNLVLPSGISNESFRVDILGTLDEVNPGSSNTMDVSISPPPLKPIKFICSIPQVAIKGVPINGNCSASSDISQASIYFQQENGSKWSNFGNNENATGTNFRFSISFNSIGKHYIRLGSDAVPAVHLAFLSPPMSVIVNAPPSKGASIGSSDTVNIGKPKGKVDKTTRAYKIMFTVGQNFAKVSSASDTAISQCGNALSHGIINAMGHPQYLGNQAIMIQSYLRTASGFQGCLDGFNS